MKRVLVESPYGSKDPKVVERNEIYVLACLHDCFLRGEAPFASHALYTRKGVLRDGVSEERKQGIEAGLVWGECAELSAVYEDFGITEGMEKGIKRALAEGRLVEYRKLPPEIMAELFKTE